MFREILWAVENDSTNNRLALLGGIFYLFYKYANKHVEFNVFTKVSLVGTFIILKGREFL